MTSDSRDARCGSPADGDAPLYEYGTDLRAGRYVGRPNRFTVDVDLGEGPEAVYLRNSGGLETTLDPGRRVLCLPAASPDRKTDYDAVAVDVEGTWVTVDATLPNELFAACVRTDRLPAFAGYELERAEPPLPDGGRADFLLASPTGERAVVEVKSNTYVVSESSGDDPGDRSRDEGSPRRLSKFPDRPTERGRRHLRTLTDLAADPGTEAHVVFVVQRPDVDAVQPFRSVDPEFADLLARAADRGVSVHAIATRFDPPAVSLADPDVAVDL